MDSSSSNSGNAKLVVGSGDTHANGSGPGEDKKPVVHDDISLGNVGHEPVVPGDIGVGDTDVDDKAAVFNAIRNSGADAPKQAAAKEATPVNGDAHKKDVASNDNRVSDVGADNKAVVFGDIPASNAGAVGSHEVRDENVPGDSASGTSSRDNDADPGPSQSLTKTACKREAPHDTSPTLQPPSSKKQKTFDFTKKKTQDLNRESGNFQRLMERLEKYLPAAYAEIDHLKEENGAKDMEVNNLKTKLYDKDRLLDDSKEQNNRLQEDLDTKDGLLNEAVEQKGRLQAENDGQRGTIDSLLKELGRLKEVKAEHLKLLETHNKMKKGMEKIMSGECE